MRDRCAAVAQQFEIGFRVPSYPGMRVEKQCVPEDCAMAEQTEIVRQALARAAGTTLRRVIDTDEEDGVGTAEEGAA